VDTTFPSPPPSPQPVSPTLKGKKGNCKFRCVQASVYKEGLGRLWRRDRVVGRVDRFQCIKAEMQQGKEEEMTLLEVGKTQFPNP
jgi:hypothetical protein